jgi:EAL domain-containing protein (putative c-di-GMP-specific phosphodiesterase class I)
LDPKLLVLEITESAILQNVDETIRTLQELHTMGVKLSIDDFGKGYWPLSYLRTFPIDCLKIDQAFVRDMLRHPDDAAIVKAMISLAHSLKLEVIAEGVESKEQMSFLQENSCDVLQGFLFSQPVPVDEFSKLLENPSRIEQGA